MVFWAILILQIGCFGLDTTKLYAYCNHKIIYFSSLPELLLISPPHIYNFFNARHHHKGMD